MRQLHPELDLDGLEPLPPSVPLPASTGVVTGPPSTGVRLPSAGPPSTPPLASLPPPPPSQVPAASEPGAMVEDPRGPRAVRHEEHDDGVAELGELGAEPVEARELAACGHRRRA